MTPTKQKVYLPTEEALKEGFSNSDFDRKTGYFFTPEQLNEYTRNVIEQALETAAREAEVSYKMNGLLLTTSITNTFEETYKKFEV